MIPHVDPYTVKLVVGIIAGIVCLFTLYAVLIEAAPEGYEDQDGFHYGEQHK